MIYIQVLLFSNRWRKINIANTNHGTLKTLIFKYALNDTFNTRNRDGEANIITLTGIGGIDADNFASSIE